MIATLVHVWVQPAFVLAFEEATRINYEKSILEPGNFRFDILRDEADPTKFILYEVYESEEAAARHKETTHYLAWRDAVAPWMTRPREGVKHHLIFPGSKS